MSYGNSSQQQSLPVKSPWLEGTSGDAKPDFLLRARADVRAAQRAQGFTLSAFQG